MKKFFLVSCLILFSMMSFARDIKVNVSSLPAGIISFVSKFYPSSKIISASQESDDKDYNLKLTDGSELEFGKDAEWTEIKTKTSIPAGILPQGILDYVAKECPHHSVKYIERSKYGYQIKMDNKKRIQLNKQFKPTSFKDDND